MTGNETESPPRPGGLFVSHERNARIERHFDRLVAETGSRIDWQFTHTPWAIEDIAAGNTPLGPLPARKRLHEALRSGRLEMGYMDLLIAPLARRVASDFVWVMEYDVDYSGGWGDFFPAFEDDDADLLTTTINTIRRDPKWTFWDSAAGPLRRAEWLRAFLPLMRVSQRFLAHYDEEMAIGHWRGHYEFVFPSLAKHHGLLIEDIGGDGPFTPRNRRGLGYSNTPSDHHLSPGTFVWRPARDAYFHEAPAAFSEPGMLHHPIKAGVASWQALPDNS